MTELKFLRRENNRLIFSGDDGSEFFITGSDTLLAELRHIVRRETSEQPVRPREIQALLRAGKSTAQVCELTGASLDDVERYEEPVRAELNYVLEKSFDVRVRTVNRGDGEERFGAVIAERLLAIGASASKWSSWREPEAGWMICLEFDSDGARRAIWGFDSRRAVLTPITADATGLSKQGQVSEKLIPKLRALKNVPVSDRFDSGAFERDNLYAATHPKDLETPEKAAAKLSASESEPDPSTAETAAHQAQLSEKTVTQTQDDTASSISPENSEEAWQRKQGIDELAVNRPAEEEDYSQTADLLDALRRKRGERQTGNASAINTDSSESVKEPTPELLEQYEGADASPFDRTVVLPTLNPKNNPADDTTATIPEPPAEPVQEDLLSAGKMKPANAKKNRRSMPSWEDIVLGTRTETDAE